MKNRFITLTIISIIFTIIILSVSACNCGNKMDNCAVDTAGLHFSPVKNDCILAPVSDTCCFNKKDILLQLNPNNLTGFKLKLRIITSYADFFNHIQYQQVYNQNLFNERIGCSLLFKTHITNPSYIINSSFLI